MAQIAAVWRTRSGVRRISPADVLSVDVDAYTELSLSGEGGIDRVDFSIVVNGGAPTVVSVTAPSMRFPNYSNFASPIPGAIGSMASAWMYGTTLDCTTFPDGSTVVVNATVYGNNGATFVMPSAVTLYYDPLDTMRPSKKTIYVSPLGSNVNSGLDTSHPVKDIAYGLLLCRANPALGTAAGFDCGGAQLVLMAGTHAWVGPGSGSWHCSGAWWLDFIGFDGAAMERHASSSQLVMTGAGAGTACRIRVQNVQVYGLHLDLIESATTCESWWDGCTHSSRYYTPAAPKNIKYIEATERNDSAFAIRQNINTKLWASCSRALGCYKGFGNFDDMQDCTVEHVLAEAILCGNTTTGQSALNVLIRSVHVNYPTIAGWLNTTAGSLITASVPAPGQIRLDATAQLYNNTGSTMDTSQPTNIATQVTQFIGDSKWGVQLTDCFGAGVNGVFPVLATGTNGSGFPYIVLSNTPGVTVTTGPRPSTAMLRCAQYTVGFPDPHPDIIHYYTAPGNPTWNSIHHNVAAVDVIHSQGMFQECALERCWLVNCSLASTLPSSDLRNPWGHDTTDCGIIGCSWDSQIDWTTSTHTRLTIVDNVFRGYSNFPSSGGTVFVDHNHVVSGAAIGTNGTTGAWFQSPGPGSTPWSFEPTGANLNSGSTLWSRPSVRRWPGATGDSRGVDIATGLQDWSASPSSPSGIVGVGNIPLGLAASGTGTVKTTGQGTAPLVLNTTGTARLGVFGTATTTLQLNLAALGTTDMPLQPNVPTVLSVEWSVRGRAAFTASSVSPSDSSDLPANANSIFIGGAGNVSLLLEDGSTQAFANVRAGTTINLRIRRVNSTGTTATSIIALY